MEEEVDMGMLAASYRRLVLWAGVQYVIIIVGAFAIILARGYAETVLAVALARVLGILVTIVALAIYAYRTASALGSRVGVLWAVAMVIPFWNVITILVLSSRATKACRNAGIPVGFFGPKLEAVRKPERQQ
ncbi:MAG: hypothetical protein GXP48_00400 [Acidobacteria bacterium]|nr:hypothetical protein [Acidobacteriota bacterium]